MANFTIPFVTVLNYDRVSGGPEYSTVVEFMCINRQCKSATIIIKSGP